MHLRDYVETRLVEYVQNFKKEQVENRAIARKLGRKHFPPMIPMPTIAQLNFEREKLVKEYERGTIPLEPLNGE